MKINKNAILLFIAALIWGVAFVSQSQGGAIVGSYSFNCVRFIIGGVVLIPVILIFDKLKLSTNVPTNKSEVLHLVRGGILCGIALCIASNFQQVGIDLGTEAGKAGFLTACYILIVPIIGLFFGKKCGLNIWIGVILALGGLYLLCNIGTSGMDSFRFSDILVIICALCFSVQIMLMDHYSPISDCLRLCSIEFLVCGILTGIPMVMFELIPNGFNSWIAGFSSFDAWGPILYAGIMSSGIAYTLQAIGQKNVNPAVASLIMSLESVFSVLAGMIILHEKLSPLELSGCALLFIAIIIAQIDFKKQ